MIVPVAVVSQSLNFTVQLPVHETFTFGVIVTFPLLTLILAFVQVHLVTATDSQDPYHVALNTLADATLLIVLAQVNNQILYGVVIVNAAFVHCHVFVTQVLDSLFASMTSKLTAYLPTAFNVFSYFLLVPLGILSSCRIGVPVHLFHSYNLYFKLPHHVSVHVNVYINLLHSTLDPLLLIVQTGFSFVHVAVFASLHTPLH